jgi:uncharacterized protein YbjQ (UPF0145 family)
MTDDIAPLTPLPIPVATANTINGQNGTLVGPAFGVIVRSPGFGRNLVGSFKSFKKGDITEYSGTLEEARRHAVDRLVEHAQAIGGNAVTALRFDSSDIGEDLVEVVAYGTAVVL